MNPNLTKISAGRYQHTSGAIITRRSGSRLGRNGFVLAGWAILVDGREVNRWSTLARAAEEADNIPAPTTVNGTTDNGCGCDDGDCGN
jgi:hypothetical protein